MEYILLGHSNWDPINNYDSDNDADGIYELTLTLDQIQLMSTNL